LSNYRQGSFKYKTQSTNKQASPIKPKKPEDVDIINR